MANETQTTKTRKGGTMTTKHTPPEWGIEPLQEDIIQRGPAFVISAHHAEDVIALVPQRANAEHIVVCVNNCEGINPEAVSNLLAACRVCVSAINELHGLSDSSTNWVNILAAKNLAIAAIAKAEGNA